MFRLNKVEPTILEEGEEGNGKDAEGSTVSSVVNDDVDRPANPAAKSSPPTPVNGSLPVTPRETTSHRSAVVPSRRPSLASDFSGRRSSSVAYYMDRVQSRLRKTFSVYARKQLFQTQKFFTPFKRWFLGFYGRYEPPLDLAMSDLKDNRSGGWMIHPRTMCCVHIIQVQLVIYRKASFYRVLETYVLTALPIWGCFLFQGSILYFLYTYLKEIPIKSTGFCTNSFLLEYSTLVVFCMYVVVENTERFEANALAALSPIYGRLPNTKKFDIEGGEVKPGLHNLIMMRHFTQFMRSKTSFAIKVVYLCTLAAVAFDIYIFVVIIYVGCKYIAMSDGVSDLIQSAVALSFIWSLNDVVFNQTYSSSIVEDIQSIFLLVPTNESDWDNVPDVAALNDPTATSSRKPSMLPASAFEAVAAQLAAAAPHLSHRIAPTSSVEGAVNGNNSNKHSFGSDESEENLEEHVLFQNNHVIYNAFFVICMVFLPICIAGALIPTRLHYCGTEILNQWKNGQGL